MILLTGAGGFVGREVLRELLLAGHHVRVLARRPFELNGGEDAERVHFFYGDIMHPETLAGACEGVTAVIHLVGIISERGEATYARVHIDGTENILAEAKHAGVKRFLHMSALGTRAGAKSEYFRTKWEAENLVRGSGLAWTIFRPSVIIGERGEFVRMVAGMTRFPLNKIFFGKLPVIGGGKTILRPVRVELVARAFVRAVANSETIGWAIEVGGPEMNLRELMGRIARAAGAEPEFIRVPFFIAAILAHIMRWSEAVVHTLLPLKLSDMLPAAPLNPSMVRMLRENQVCDPDKLERLLGIRSAPIYLHAL